jgi:hypothetical protein
MQYPPDGTAFEIDSPTIALLYKAVAGSPLTLEERMQAQVAVDYIAAATLVVTED